MLACPAVGTAEELPDAERQRITGEVTAAAERYDQCYADRKLAPLSVGLFDIPWAEVGNRKINTDTTMEEAQAGFEAALADVLERDWDRSVYTATHVCVVNAHMAIISGYNTRWHEDGRMMSVEGVAHVFARDGDAWKIISCTGQPQDQKIRCD